MSNAGIAQSSHSTAITFPDDSWMPLAPCREVSVNFHADRPIENRLAKQVCATCPFMDPCLEYALAAGPRDQYGVWGGLTANERRRMLRARIS